MFHSLTRVGDEFRFSIAQPLVSVTKYPSWVSRPGSRGRILPLREPLRLPAEAAPALRRSAPARRHRPGDRARAQGVPVRRAALQPRRRLAGADAGRDRRTAQRAEDDDDLRHPRPGRGDDHGQQDRGARQGFGNAGRLAARALQQAERAVRRRLHRLAENEPDPRRSGGQARARRRSASGPSTPTFRLPPASGRPRSGSPSISAPTPSCTPSPTSSGR